jgi:hypothetical protein
MKHITYTPSSDEYDYLEGSKDTLIFHNIIIVNFYALTLDEFKNSFNDIDEPKYLNSDYKEKVVRAYLENQREFPNEDLMYFDRELSDFEKILVVKYSKNKKMIELLSQDENHSIREVVAFRKDLPKHIVDNFIVDPVASVRESVIVSGRPLSKEQLKLFAKDTDRNIARVLLSSQNVKIDDELIDYFVKNGSFIVKEVLCGAIPDLTDEQIEYLAKPQNSNLETKCILASSYKLTDTIINSWLASKSPELHNAIVLRNDLTKSMIDIIIAKNKRSLNVGLIYNGNLFKNFPEIYQYAMSSVLLNSDSSDTICKTLYRYIHNLDKLKFKLSNDVLQHLVEFNYKKGDMGLADYILQIPNIPQSMVERVAFDSAINYLFDVNYNGKKEYYTVGVNTPYFNLALKIKDYVQKSGYVQPIPRF